MTAKLILALLVGSACTAHSLSPPLSGQTARPYGTVEITSGEFDRAHTITGVVQMTQTGYRWMHEVEVVADADPRAILTKIGLYAREHGADGVQHVELLDLDPQTEGDKRVKEINTAMNAVRQVRAHETPTALGEGTETRYQVKGELVVFPNK